MVANARISFRPTAWHHFCDCYCIFVFHLSYDGWWFAPFQLIGIELFPVDLRGMSNPEAVFEVRVHTRDKQHITAAAASVPRPPTPDTVHIWGPSPETDPPAPPLTRRSSSAKRAASGDRCVFPDWTLTKSNTFRHSANWFTLPVKAAHLSLTCPLWLFCMCSSCYRFSACLWLLCLACLLCYITGHIHDGSCFWPSRCKPSTFSC